MKDVFGLLRAAIGPLVLVAVLALGILPAMAQDDALANAYGQLTIDTSNPAGEAGPDQYAVAAESLSMLSETQLSLKRVYLRLTELIAHVPDLAPSIHSLLVAESPTGEARYFAAIVGWTFAFLGIAYLIEWQIYGMRLVGPWFIALQKPNPQGLVEKLPILSLRAGIGVVGIALSSLMTAAMAFSIIDPAGDAPQKTILVVIAAVIASRLTAILWRMVLSPYLSHYRIPCMDDHEARRLFRWLWLTVTFSIALLAFCYWIEDIGASRETHNTLTLIATILMVIVNLAMVLVNRSAITRAILGQCHVQTVPLLPRISAMLWAPLVVLYFLGASVILIYRLLSGTVSGAPMIVGAYTVLLAVIVAYGVVAFSIARLFRSRRVVVAKMSSATLDKPGDNTRIVEHAYIEGDPLEGDGDEESGPAMMDRSGTRSEINDPTLTGMRDFEALARRAASIFAFGAGIYALLHIWDFDYMLDEGGLLDPVQDVIDICLIGYLLYHTTRIWIDTRIREEGGDEDDAGPMDGEGGEGNAGHAPDQLFPRLGDGEIAHPRHLRHRCREGAQADQEAGRGVDGASGRGAEIPATPEIAGHLQDGRFRDDHPREVHDPPRRSMDDAQAGLFAPARAVRGERREVRASRGHGPLVRSRIGQHDAGATRGRRRGRPDRRARFRRCGARLARHGGRYALGRQYDRPACGFSGL